MTNRPNIPFTPYDFTVDPSYENKTGKWISKEQENVKMLLFQRRIPEQPDHYYSMASDTDILMYSIHSLGARAAICSIQNLLHYPLPSGAPIRLRGLITYLGTLDLSNSHNVIGTLHRLRKHALFSEYIHPSWEKIKAFLMMMGSTGLPLSVSDDYQDYCTEDKITTVLFKGFTVTHSSTSRRYGQNEMQGEFYTCSVSAADIFKHLLAHYNYSEEE
ncbi:VP4B [Carcinus maenas reovirus]|nr:VP4B [Carcinus maenas reovirus]